MQYKITFIITATDETFSLIKTVDYIMTNCNRTNIETILIVIPENASSACLETIDSLKKKFPEFVKELVQARPYIGGALKDAIDATKSSHVMFLSADIPTELEGIPLLLDQSLKNPEMIIKVSRWINPNSFVDYNKTRLIFNYLAQFFLKILFLSNLTDFTCPVLISPAKYYKQINFKELKFPFLLEMVLIPLRTGAKFKEVPIKCLSRKEGTSKNSSLQTFLYLKTALRIRITPKKDLTKPY